MYHCSSLEQTYPKVRSIHSSFQQIFSQAFPETGCLICITPSHTDCSHLVLLSSYHAFLHRHQEGRRSNRAQAHMCRHTECTEMERQRHFQQHLAEQCLQSLQVADAQSIPQERQKDSVVQAHPRLHALTDTPAHRPLPLPPAHPQRFQSSSPAPTYDAKTKTLLELEMEKLHWGKEEGGQGRDFLLYFAQGFFFFWQTRIPFELIHFFLPRIWNDNA